MNIYRKRQPGFRGSKFISITKVSLLLLLGLMIVSNMWIARFIDSFIFKHWRFPNNPKLPKHHIAFLKIHKSGGSTIQNILMRYGETHNSTFVLSCRSNYLTFDTPFNIRKLFFRPAKLQSKYDILTHHAIFSKKGFAEVMYDDATYVTILRDPVDVFESLYEFVNFQKVYSKNLTEFIKWKNKPKADTKTRISNHIGRNQMMFDLGFNANEFDDIDKVNSWIKFISESFDLIMIAERFDESLILLKNLMGWTVDDVVYLTHNARQKSYINHLARDEREILRQYNLADQLLYDYFYDIFDKKVIQFGKKRMKAELNELQSTIARYKLVCNFEMRNSTNITGVYKPWSNKVFGYHLNPNSEINCKRLAMAELQFTGRLQKRQKLKCIKPTKTKRKKGKAKVSVKVNGSLQERNGAAKLKS